MEIKEVVPSTFRMLSFSVGFMVIEIFTVSGDLLNQSAWLNYRQWIPAILFAVTAEVLYRYERKRIG